MLKDFLLGVVSTLIVLRFPKKETHKYWKEEF